MTTTLIAPAKVNGVPLHQPDEVLDDDTLRQRACTELLRQAAQRAGLETVSVPDAIERLLDRAVVLDEPTDEACRRAFDARPERYARQERLQLRHILFAVTPGVDVAALRRRAEALLLELRCAVPGSPAFGDAARQWSNCPTGAQGGELGWLSQQDCAEEFARAVFGQDTIGVLPLLVHSRFGLHVVEVQARDAGAAPAFEDVRAAVAQTLRQQAWANAVRHYLQTLAEEAVLEGVRLDAEAATLAQ
ncbi:MAG TPA: peptidylprolyl isomerase [Ideonella sp.]|uniref:peptidylprolyl isomerase n=1 Tax=Ideonella sp. TaxID=1929293 RepID=UPI002E33F17F|nr:peptidylprolyl isomerase [Ideonella sp.]HEX5687548.1 peptidylprolyl isomerase [Ideonella sp.]